MNKFYDEDLVDDQDEIFTPVYQSLMLNPKYSGNEVLAWIGLKNYAIGSKRHLWAKKKSLAKSCKLSETTLWRTLTKLEEKGVIVIIPNYNENWKQVSNNYYLAKFDPEKGDWKKESLDLARKQKARVLEAYNLYISLKKEKELGQGGTRTNS